jgi:hypothetical protein
VVESPLSAPDGSISGSLADGCLLGRILEDWEQGQGRGERWDELKGKTWGREMWEAIVPSGRVRQERS